MTYLKKNSSAGDTASGILQWWLQNPDPRVDSLIVEAAMDSLIHAGVAGARMLESGERFYFGLGNSGAPA